MFHLILIATSVLIIVPYTLALTDPSLPSYSMDFKDSTINPTGLDAPQDTSPNTARMNTHDLADNIHPDLVPRDTLTASCYVYTASSGTPGVPKYAYYYDIFLNGGWPNPSGLQAQLNTTLGSENVLQFTSVTGGANFFAPALVNQKIVHWDSQVAASIKAFSGSANVVVTPQYPGL